MILATHVIFSAYGFWLPNDPRGSWSEFVGAWDLFIAGGRATKIDTRHSVAHVPHDAVARRAVKAVLKYPPVRFTVNQIAAIARGFERAITETRYLVYACAILYDHAHLVLGRSDRPAPQIVGHLKARASQQLIAEGLHPFVGALDRDGSPPTVWAGKCWKVFIDRSEDVPRAIEYVERNPQKHGMRRQSWSFVRAYS